MELCCPLLGMKMCLGALQTLCFGIFVQALLHKHYQLLTISKSFLLSREWGVRGWG